MSSVSVLIPTYNRAQMIRRAVASAQEQTFPPTEIIIVDDGSTDITPIVLENLRKTEPRIRTVIAEQNRGVAAARNRCLAEARGDFVAFLDSDDAWRPRYLESCLTFFAEFPDLDAVGADIQYVTSDGRLIADQNLWTNKQIYRFLDDNPTRSDHYRFKVPEADALLHAYLLRIQATVVRRSAAVACPFDESLRIGEDWDFFLRMARAGRRFGFIHTVFCEMVVHEDNLVSNNRNQIRESEEVAKVWQKMLNDPTVTPTQRQLIRDQLSKLRFDEGYVHYLRRHRWAAVRAYWNSLRARFSYRVARALVLAAILPGFLIPSEEEVRSRS